MSRLILMAIALVLGAGESVGSNAEPRLSRNTIIENVRYSSPNGRFVLVMRQFQDVPDLKGRRADRIFRFSIRERTKAAGGSWMFTQPNRGHYAGGPAFPVSTAALYDEKLRIALIRFDFPWRGGEVRVSDSGRYVVILPDGPFNNERSPEVSIYRSDGSPSRHLFADEVLSPNDRWDRIFYSVTPSIRENDESGRDLLLLTVPESPKAIRIDLEAGSRLSELRDIFPSPRTWATPAASRHFAAGTKSEPPACVDGAAEPAEVIALDSAELVASAIDNPLPDYPPVARKARVQGTVSIELIVSERGEVICARTSAFPFGLSQAAEAAARRWRFRPHLVNRKPVKVRGELEFHFFRVADKPATSP